MTARAQVRSPGPLLVAVVGVSTTAICGVRDHATVLSAALATDGWRSSAHWLDRSEASLRGASAQMRKWSRGLPAQLAAERADVALLHYSVFSYSFRGLPLFVSPVLSALRRSGVPVVTILHEFVYPWRRDGLRGGAWAVSQRALLIDVVRTSDALVTTTDFQAEWLASRRWLPGRRVAVAPVFSNLPEPALRSAPTERDEPTIGLFGYAYGAATVALVLDALRLLHDRGVHARIELLGAPGASSPAGDHWRALARARSLDRAVSFSGTLAAQELSDALAACDVLLFVDPLGPNPRKTTLAASLASGRPVVALDGPRSWAQLRDAGAACIVPPQPPALADALAELLGDRDLRASLSQRGRSFARQGMSAQSSAAAIGELIERTLARR
jgi:glycosyltransferase involved in cell wall biosynthesis